jgi:hypothetical protein
MRAMNKRQRHTKQIKRYNSKKRQTGYFRYIILLFGSALIVLLLVFAGYLNYHQQQFAIVKNWTVVQQPTVVPHEIKFDFYSELPAD